MSFSIYDYTGSLKKVQGGGGKYYCPNCQGHNFSIASSNGAHRGAYMCGNGCSPESIRLALGYNWKDDPKYNRGNGFAATGSAKPRLKKRKDGAVAVVEPMEPQRLTLPTSGVENTESLDEDEDLPPVEIKFILKGWLKNPDPFGGNVIRRRRSSWERGYGFPVVGEQLPLSERMTYHDALDRGIKSGLFPRELLQYDNLSVTIYKYGYGRVLRFEYQHPTKGRRKDFRQQHWDEHRGWVWGEGDINFGFYPHGFEPKGKLVLVHEGEKCTDLANSVGVESVTLRGSVMQNLEKKEREIETLFKWAKERDITLLYLADLDKVGLDKGEAFKAMADKYQAKCLVATAANWMPSDKVRVGDDFEQLMSVWEDKSMKGAPFFEFIHELRAWVEENNFFADETPEVEEVPPKGKERRELKFPKGEEESAFVKSLCQEWHCDVAWDSKKSRWLFWNDETKMWDEEPELIALQAYDAAFEQQYGLPPLKNHMDRGTAAMKRYLGRKEFNQPAHLLAFKNGVMNLDTGEFIDNPGRELRIQMQLPRELHLGKVDLAAQCPTINTFLWDMACGKQAVYSQLVATAAAVMTRRSDLQRFVHLIGGGGSGKGTYLRLLEELVGEDNCGSTNLELLARSTYATANIIDKMLVTLPDQTPTMGASIGTLLSLTGKDRIPVERKYRDAYNDRFKGIIVIASNEPVMKGSSSAINRRALVISCDARPGRRIDFQWEKLQDELGAFTAHLLQLDRDWVTRTMGGDKESQQSGWQLRCQSDSLASWVHTHLAPGSAVDSIRVGTASMGGSLYASYVDYCKEAGLNAVSLNTFGGSSDKARLMELLKLVLGWDVSVKKNGREGTRIAGIRWLGDNEEPWMDSQSEQRVVQIQDPPINRLSVNEAQWIMAEALVPNDLLPSLGIKEANPNSFPDWYNEIGRFLAMAASLHLGNIAINCIMQKMSAAAVVEAIYRGGYESGRQDLLEALPAIYEKLFGKQSIQMMDCLKAIQAQR